MWTDVQERGQLTTHARYPARGDDRRDATRRIQVKLEGNTPDWWGAGGGGGEGFWRRRGRGRGAVFVEEGGGLDPPLLPW